MLSHSGAKRVNPQVLRLTIIWKLSQRLHEGGLAVDLKGNVFKDPKNATTLQKVQIVRN